MGDRLRAGIPSRYVTSQLGQLSLASLPPGSLNRVPASTATHGWMGYCPISLQNGNGSICLQKYKPYNFLHRMPIEALCSAGARLLLLVGYEGGGNVTSAGWQVTLCDPMWHVRSRSGVATLRTAIHLLLTYLPGENGSGEPPGLGQSRSRVQAQGPYRQLKVKPPLYLRRKMAAGK